MKDQNDFEITDLDEEDGYGDYDLNDDWLDEVDYNEIEPVNSEANTKNQMEPAAASKKKSVGILASILIGCAAVCLVAGVAILVMRVIDDRQAQQSIDHSPIVNLVDNNNTVNQEPDIKDEIPQSGSIPEETKDQVPDSGMLIPNPYADYYLKNTDMAGWLVVPGTKMDYPIMQTPEDENFYLYLDFDKKDNKNGSLILDTDSSLGSGSTNLIIHGHNMKSGAMFGDLEEYKKENYYLDHKTMILYTKEYQRNYEVIAVFYTQVYKKTDDVFKFYKYFMAETEEEFMDFYDNIKALSIYDTGVTAEFGDRFLTLSTCSYQVENGRFVVIAKEVEPGDYYEPVEEP